MQEHTVDFPGFSTALAGTETSFSTAFTSPRAGGRLSVRLRWRTVAAGDAGTGHERPPSACARSTARAGSSSTDRRPSWPSLRATSSSESAAAPEGRTPNPALLAKHGYTSPPSTARFRTPAAVTAFPVPSLERASVIGCSQCPHWPRYRGGSGFSKYTPSKATPSVRQPGVRHDSSGRQRPPERAQVEPDDLSTCPSPTGVGLSGSLPTPRLQRSDLPSGLREAPRRPRGTSTCP